MSLTSFIRRPDVLAQMKALRPKPPRKIPAPICVPLKTKNGPIVGMAFDYFLRMELQRRAPWAKAKQWVAETAAGFAGGISPNVVDELS